MLLAKFGFEVGRGHGLGFGRGSPENLGQIWAVNKVYFTQYFQQKYHYYGWNPIDYKVTLKIDLRVRVQISM